MPDVWFDTHGWTATDDGFASPRGDRVRIFRFDQPPDIDADLGDLAALRRAYRRRADDAGLGVIEIDVVEVAGIPAVRTLFKAALEPRGRAFIGALTIPRRDHSHVLRVQAQETGMTGLREAMVLAETTSAREGFGGWQRDPYDPDVTGPLTMNRADEPQYDARLPEHPLSRVRAALRHVEATLQVDRSVREAAPFRYPAPP